MNNQYQYVGEPLTRSMVQELIIELFAGQTASRQEILDAVDKVHLDRGGKPTELVIHPVGQALRFMKIAGLAENSRRGFWRILSEEPSEAEPSEELKALEERIARLENVVLLVLSSEIGNYVSGSAEEYLLNFQSFTVRQVKQMLQEYGTLEEAIENFLNIAEEKSGYR